MSHMSTQSVAAGITLRLPALVPPSSAINPTSREICLEVIQDLYPNITHRDDFDVFHLSSGNYTGPPDSRVEIYAWLDKERERYILAMGCPTREEGLAKFEETMKSSLDERLPVFGRKPRPGDSHALTRSIPDSGYSIRLWPDGGDEYSFCIDFILTETGVPTNSPPGYELWAASPYGLMLLTSMEAGSGLSPNQIRPGAEKFLLPEGTECVLTRLDHPNVRFTVPRRHHQLPEGNYQVLDFPSVVY